jgi:hypothetical protein
MNSEEELLQKALLLTYLHSKLCIKNADCALHEMKVLKHPLLGTIQHKFEKLINAHRKALSILEKNIEDKDLLEKDLEGLIDISWTELSNQDVTDEIKT